MTVPASGTKVIGDKPIEALYAEAWASLAQARANASEIKPDGPGWISYDEFSQRHGLTPGSGRDAILRMRKQGLVETFQGQKIVNRRRIATGWVRPILDTSKKRRC